MKWVNQPEGIPWHDAPRPPVVFRLGRQPYLYWGWKNNITAALACLPEDQKGKLRFIRKAIQYARMSKDLGAPDL
jgi:hypothetical protein